MHPLTAYLQASGETPPDFARRINLDTDNFHDIIAQRASISLVLARRISKATAGAVTVEDLFQHGGEDAAPVVDFSARREGSRALRELDPTAMVEGGRLSAALRGAFSLHLPTAMQGPASKRAVRISEAAAHLYDLLGETGPVNPRDRLRAALLSVLPAALGETEARREETLSPEPKHFRRIADEAARRYFE